MKEKVSLKGLDIKYICYSMKTQIKLKKYDKAIMIYNKFSGNHNDFTNTLYIKACIGDNKLNRVNHLIRHININDDINKHSIQFITILIQYYGKINDINNALKCYNNYSNDNKYKDDTLSLTIIKVCADLKQFDAGEYIIGKLNIINELHNKNIELITTLMIFYSSHDKIDITEKIFYGIKNEYKIKESSVTMMQCYLEHGMHNEFMNLYEKYGNNNSNVLYLKSCINGNDYAKGKEYINSLNVRDNVSDYSIEFISSLMNFYIHFNEDKEALFIYDSYKETGKHNDVTHLLYLKACMNLKDYSRGKEFINKLKIIKNINNYSIELVNTLMNFYVESSQFDTAINIYQKYNNKDNTTKLFVLKACIGNNNYIKGETFISKEWNINIKEMNDYSIEFITTLMHFYGNKGDVTVARNVFDSIDKDKLNINCIACMMNVYKMNKEYDKALELYFNIKSTNKYTFHEHIYCIILFCCGENGLINEGELIIDDIKQHNMYSNPFIQAAIINLYSKSGNYDQAIHIFNESSSKNNIIVYSAIMDCYAKMGEYQRIIETFNDIMNNNIPINDKVYAIVINACSHTGSLNEALVIFKELFKSKTIYDKNLLTSMVDCYARNNHLSRALFIYEVINNKYRDIDNSIKLNMSRCILSSSVTYNDINMAQKIFNQMQDIYKYDNKMKPFPADYILMANLYGKQKQYNKMHKIRALMKELKLK